MRKQTYQYDFSEHHPVLYDLKGREQKAKKIIAVLNDHFGGSTGGMTLLDIGSSTGIMTHLLSHSFAFTTGIDIDEKAVAYSREQFSSPSLTFQMGDSMNLPFEANSFDVVNCTQVYEHVPDSTKLMAEIYRVLKPGGVCFFAAGNRYVLMEGHYHLPLLSVVPKPVAHLYLRMLGRGKYYYENHLSCRGLKKLVRNFEVIDYTRKIIQDPDKFCATEMITGGSFKQKIALLFTRIAYWLVPDYIWLLKKPGA